MSKRVTAPTWAEINLDNIKSNINNIKNLLNEDTKICGVVKANAYGHGAVEVAKLMEKENVDYIAVARLEEAIELRQNDITLPILCLGFIPDSGIENAIKNKIEMTVYSSDMAQKVSMVAKELDIEASIHIKLDTGMRRIGFESNEESIKAITEINNLEFIKIQGIFTHFAKADEVSKEFTYSQFEKFNYVIDRLEEEGVKIPVRHVSNSAATMDCSDLKLNMVRCGIILYGHYPSDDVLKENIELKPAMTLKTTVAHIKTLEPGEGISYGLKYITTGNEKIVTIPIGYADGFIRIQNNPKVFIKGEVFDVVGRICMDQCMVKINKDIDIKIGDEVIIFGENSISVEEMANDLGTINYEVLCMVSRRVDRVYVEKNEILQINSYLLK